MPSATRSNPHLELSRSPLQVQNAMTFVLQLPGELRHRLQLPELPEYSPPEKALQYKGFSVSVMVGMHDSTAVVLTLRSGRPGLPEQVIRADDFYLTYQNWLAIKGFYAQHDRDH